jgi:hypothetical protein
VTGVTQSVFFAAVALAWITFGWIRRRRAVSRMPEIPDEEFLRRFGERFSAPRARILEARRRVSKVLLVPERKLAPEYTFKELAQKARLIGDLGMAWENLEEDVSDAAWKAGKPRPAQAVRACPTVGDLVAGLIQAQELP